MSKEMLVESTTVGEVVDIVNDECSVEETKAHLAHLRSAYSRVALYLTYVGYELKWFRDYRRYKDLGYETFEDFAKSEFELARASAYNYISVFEKCTNCIEQQGHMMPKIELKEEYKDYGFSKLIEISKLKDEEKDSILKEINPNMSVRDIKNTIKGTRDTPAPKKSVKEAINIEESIDDTQPISNETSIKEIIDTQGRSVVEVSGSSWEDIISSKTQKAVNKILEAETSIDDLVIEIVISHRNIA